MALVAILGIGLVAVSRTSREALAAPRIGDHWHEAYEVYDCASDSFLPSFQGEGNPDGIHTHGDGLTHIEPANSSATGANATLGVFLSAVGASVTTQGISAPDFATLSAGVDCGGQPSVIKVARYAVDPNVSLVKVYDSNFDSIRYDKNRQAFTIARVAPDQVPPPPDAAHLDALDQATGVTRGPAGSNPGDGGHGASPDTSTTTVAPATTSATATTTSAVATTTSTP